MAVALAKLTMNKVVISFFITCLMFFVVQKEDFAVRMTGKKPAKLVLPDDAFAPQRHSASGYKTKNDT